MKLIKGNKYQYWYVKPWVYDGLYEGDYTCDDCDRPRQRLHWFFAEDNPDDTLKLGTECVKEMTDKIETLDY